MTTAEEPPGNDAGAPPAPAPHPWEQQPGESDLMYGRFRVFRDTPAEQRQVKAVAQKLIADDRRPRKPTLASLLTVASRFRWVERARAWDAVQDAEAQAAALGVRDRIVQEHLAFAKVIRDRVREELDAKPLGEASHTELARWWDLAVKVERQSLGMDLPQRVEHTGGDGGPIHVSLDGLDPDTARRELADLLAEGHARVDALRRADDDDAD